MNHHLSKRPNHPILADRVLAAIEHNQLISEGIGVLVGVSGGPDSMALLHLLHQMARFPLRAVHLNHLLRPDDCDADEALVRSFCENHAIEYVSRSIDVAAFAAINGLGLEAAGRVCRHQFFMDSASEWLTERKDLLEVRMALAHHLDDQAETILLHLGRGCGLAGLGGMTPLSGPFIRPLLGIRRQEILQYLDEHAVPYHTDVTNQDLFTLRNRLRHQVLPIWQDVLGYDPATALARMAELVREDECYLTQQTESAWLSMSGQMLITADSSPGSASQEVRLDRALFRKEHPAIQNRLLRLAWRKVSGQARDIEWRHLQLARDLILQKRPKGHLDWPQGVVMDLLGPSVRFSQTGRHTLDKNSLHKVAFETRIQDDRLL